MASPPGGAPCEGVVPLSPADARPCMERATRDQPTTARAPHGDFACGEELNHLCTSPCFSMGTGSSDYVAVQPGVVCTRAVRVLHNRCVQ